MEYRLYIRATMILDSSKQLGFLWRKGKCYRTATITKHRLSRIRGRIHAHACTTKMSYIKSNVEFSKTLITNDGALTTKTKVRSKNRREISSNARNIARNFVSNVRAVRIIARTFARRCHEISVIFHRYFTVSEKPRISSKFACTTFAQYCTSSSAVVE